MPPKQISQHEPAPDVAQSLTLEQRRGLLEFDFWQSTPVSPWPEYMASIEEALNCGIPAVIVSGRNGTGKTMQLGGALERRGGYIILDPTADMVGLDWQKVTEPVIHLDEVTEVLASDKDGPLLDWVEDGVKQGKQFLIVLPGVHQPTRQYYGEALEAGLKAQGINSLRLPDISSAYVDASKAGELFATLGVKSEVIDLFSSCQALRAPRLFEALIMRTFPLSHPEVAAQVSVKDIIQALLPNITGLDVSQAANSIAISMSEHTISHPHLLFATPSLSTADSRQLYELTDQPLPKPASPALSGLGYDPFQKS